MCSIYKSETLVCNDVLALGIDYVYARSTLGDQLMISQFLNDYVINNSVTHQHESCVKQVYTILCQFYLPTCGNTTYSAAPSSVCQEDCQRVQENCLETWNDASSVLNNTLPLLNLNNTLPLLNCNDTSSLLKPMTHCCNDRLCQ